jgi:hypothetical protein
VNLLARIHPSESGSVVLSVLVVVVVVTVLAFGLLANSAAAYRMQTSNSRRVQAVLLAEGGAEAAYNLLKTNPGYRKNTGFTAVIGSEAVTGTISVDGSSYMVESTAAVGSQSHSVSLKVKTIAPPPPPIYGYGLYAGESVEGTNNNIVKGSDIVSGGPIIGFETSPGFAIRPNETSFEFPILDPEEYRGYPAPEVTPGDDSHIIVNGYRFFDGALGNLNMNSVRIESPSGDGVLFINGNLLAKNNLEFSGNITVIVAGDMDCKNSLGGLDKLHLVIGGDIDLKNNMTLTGTVTVGGSFKAKNNTTVTFRAVGDSGVPGYDPTEIAGWSREWVR